MGQNNLSVSREHIYLAALLHDVGKFYERAYPGELKNDEIYRYSHAAYTAKFFDLPQVHRILTQFELPQASGDFNLKNLAAKHHNPRYDWERIIQFADWLASAERKTFENVEYKEGKLHQALLSIFSNIDLSKSFSVRSSNKFLPLKVLNLEKLPELTNASEIGENDYKELWDKFLEEFCRLEGLKINHFNDTLLKLLEKYTVFIPSSTRQNEIPDITLFDHSKMTAAFAVTIYNFLQENDYEVNKVDFALSLKQKPFLLIGGDLSGIQKFIYDIINKNAAKNLKGRSFFLQILMETIVRNILNELNLTKANIVYNTGGNFYILAQNTVEAKARLENTVDKINEQLLEKYSNSIYLAVDFIEFSFVNLIPYVSCSKADESGNCLEVITREEVLNRMSKYLDINQDEIAYYLNEPELGEIWEELISVKLDQRKKQRHLKLLKSRYERFFEPLDLENKVAKKEGERGAFLRDKITGEFIFKGEMAADFGSDKIRMLTKKQIELGKLLREADFWVISKQPLKGSEKYSFNPFENSEVGVYHYFLSEQILKEKKNPIEGAEVIVLNNPSDFLKTKEIVRRSNSYLFDFYGGNDFPAYTEEDLPEDKEDIEVGDPKQFDDLAKGQSLNRLGVLRMDVDSLGKIFAVGFAKKYKLKDKDYLKKIYPKAFTYNGLLSDKSLVSFSRLATLSRSLDFFFRGYLNTIWKNNEEYAKRTMILYSGGDDVFLIGRWDKVLDMADQIRQEFKEWTTHNPNISISGGMVLVPGKFPVLKAADDAGDAENKAKRHITANGLSKNSISFLGLPLNWDEEFIYVKQWMEQMKDLVAGKVLPKGFLFTVQRFYELCKYQASKGKNPSWQWLVLYNLKRLQERSKVEARRFLDGIMKDILAMHSFTDEEGNQKQINSQYLSLELSALAARWAELWLRTNEKIK